MPVVLNKHIHGIPEGAVYVGRPSPFGNSFTLKEYSRDEAIRLFVENILPTLDCSSLTGRDLVCFCVRKPTQMGVRPLVCHAQVILEKANGWTEGE